MASLPKKINPCPIVEAIFEVRFKPSFPENAVFGILYKQFGDEQLNFVELPILQLPPVLKKTNPSLHYSPHYKAQKDNFVLQIGPRAVSISNVEEYKGWSAFSKKIYEVYSQVEVSKVIDSIERLGLRYISVLEGTNIFEDSNFSISLKEKPINRKTDITTEVSVNKAVCTLRVTSDAEVSVGAQKKKVFGSVIDIDTVVDLSDFEGVQQATEHAHNVEKEIFFSEILKEEFIETLNPEY